MTSLVRKASFLAACGLLIASVAAAGVPSAINSSIGNGIKLGGTTGGVVDVLVAKTITVRDGSNAIIVGSNVVLNFSTCHAGDIKMSSLQPAHVGFFNCPARTVYALTNGSGVATFTIAGFSTGATPALSAACATVVADGQLLGNLLVSTVDENGIGGVNPTDGTLWQADRNSGIYRERSDYDANGLINPTDGSLWQQVRNAGGSSVSGAVACP